MLLILSVGKITVSSVTPKPINEEIHYEKPTDTNTGCGHPSFRFVHRVNSLAASYGAFSARLAQDGRWTDPFLLRTSGRDPGSGPEVLRSVSKPEALSYCR